MKNRTFNICNNQQIVSKSNNRAEKKNKANKILSQLRSVLEILTRKKRAVVIKILYEQLRLQRVNTDNLLNCRLANFIFYFYHVRRDTIQIMLMIWFHGHQKYTMTFPTHLLLKNEINHLFSMRALTYMGQKA